ncbi:1-acyl-SN-glycerol-3-phosphate acyltransferase [Neisseria gonorrhoeae]|nr:1-acyl-SN-glycerol-3-phosphate acyltransferase [Neisseria gonorrhoeae]
MLIIRNLIYWLILCSSLIFLFPFMLLASPFRDGAHKMARVWVGILNWSLKHIVGLKYRIIGAEHIPDRPSPSSAPNTKAAGKRSRSKRFFRRRFTLPSASCSKSPFSAGA